MRSLGSLFRVIGSYVFWAMLSMIGAALVFAAISALSLLWRHR